MRVKAKKSVEVPEAVQSFIATVEAAGEHDLADVLQCFEYNDDKGDFYHWVGLMNYFDAWFEKHINTRTELHLSFEESSGVIHNAGSVLFAKTLLQILRVTAAILETCSNKHLYHSYEYLCLLLAADEPEVVVAALRVLVVFVRKTHSSGVRWHGDPALNVRLLAMAQGWGGKEEGMDLLTCASDNSDGRFIEHLSGTLHFEFYGTAKNDSPQEGGQQIIHLSGLHNLTESDLAVVGQLVLHYSVPLKLRFSLLSKLRIARCFSSLAGRRHLIRMRLMAFYILFQSNPVPEEASAFFLSEPEFVNELVGMLHAEDRIPEELRMLSLRALAVQLLDRNRHSAVIGAISSGGEGGLLSVMMHKAVRSLSSTPSDKSSQPDRTLPLIEGGYSMQTAEALLSLIGLLVASTSGCTALSEAGMLPALLPLLKDHNPMHVPLVSNSVRIMEAFMDFSPSASVLFRDLGGLSDIIERLQVEVQTGYLQADSADKQVKDIALPYQRRLLLKSLLRAVALASYAPSTGTAARPGDEDSQKLYGSLRAMMQRAPVFGGTLFALAASVMTDLIHHDPLCYSTLDSAGLPQAFLSAVTDGVIASSEAVCNVPNTLVALCLTSQGLERVREAKALSCFVPIMTTPTYQKSLQGETPSILGAGLDELLRHVPSLREEGVGVVLCIIRRLLELGGRSMPTSAVSANATETMDYMSEMERSKMPAAEGNADSMETDETTGSRGKQVDDFPIDSYLGDCVTHSVRMLESMLSNTETSRLFVDKGGVELLLGLYGLPKLPPSFASGTSTTNSLLPIFRLFAPIHAASLSQTVRCALDRQLMECLAVLEPVNGQCILDLPPHQQDNVIRLVSASEGLAAVAGTVVRASNVAALQEVASGIAPVLAKLCSMEQSIFQQLAALDLRREEKLSKEQMLLGASEAPTGSVTPSNAAEAVAGSSDALALEVDIDHNTPVVIGNPSASDTHLQNSDASQPTADKGRKKKSPEDSCYELLHHASITIRGLYGAVAKTIHTPVRRRDGSSTPSPTMVGAAAALGAVLKSHFKYLQERLPSENAVSAGEDGSVSTANDDRSSLRQGIRVVEETISLLFDARRHTCHHLVLNFFHRFGGMNLLLCQFDRTVAHMWKCQNENVDFQPPGTEFDNPDAAASVAPAKPNTDEDDNLVPDKDRKDLVRSPKQLAESAVLAFLGLLERLTNANLLLGGSSSSSLLTASFLQPAGSTSSTPASSASSHEGLQWIKRLQSAVVQHVLPVWNSSSLFQCSPRLVSSVITTLTNSMDGAVVAASHTATRPGGGRSHTAPDPDMIQQIVDMGFTHARAEEAFRQVGQNSIELAMEWLVSHAEEPAPGTAAMDGVSENAAGSAEEDVHQILIAAFGNDVPSLADPSDNMPKVQAEAECEVEDTIGSGHSQRAEFLLPPPQEFVDRAVLVLTSNESSSFPLADLLQTLCSKNDGKDCAAVVQHLIDALRAAAVQAALLNYESKVLLAPSLLLALLVSEDAAIRKVAAELKLVVVVLDVLQAWETARSSVALESVAGSSPQKWVDALLLVLDAMLQSYTKASVESEDVTQPAAKAQQQSDVKIMTPAAVEASNSAGACTSDSNPVNGLVYQVMQQWCPAGYLSEEEQDRALGLCLCLLRHLHSHVQQDKARGEIVPDTPDPADTCQATLQVLSHLTKRHQAALQVLNNGVPHLLLSLPQPCFKAQLEPYISAVFRHILEDPQTLQAAMEAEIRATFASRNHMRSGLMAGAGSMNSSLPLRTFLSNTSHVAARDPAVFLMAIDHICTVESSGGLNGRQIISLKKPGGAVDGLDTAAAAKEQDNTANLSLATPNRDRPKGKSREEGSKSHPRTQPSASKSSKKVVPSSFVETIDTLVDVMLHYDGPGELADDECKERECLVQNLHKTSMDIDTSLAVRGETETMATTNQNISAKAEPETIKTHQATIQCVVLKMLTDFTLMYGSCIGVILKRDVDLGGWASSHCQPVSSSARSAGKQPPPLGREHPNCSGIFRHTMRTHLQVSDSKGTILHGLAEHAAYFLLAACVRSIEGRKRIIHELVSCMSQSSSPASGSTVDDHHQSRRGSNEQNPFLFRTGCPPPSLLKAYVDLVNSLLSSSSGQPNTLGRNYQANGGLGSEMVRVMREGGMVKALTQTLTLLDMDHPRAPKSVNAVLKPLEILTRHTAQVYRHSNAATNASDSSPPSFFPRQVDEQRDGGTTALGDHDGDHQDITNSNAHDNVGGAHRSRIPTATPGREADLEAGPVAQQVAASLMEASEGRQARADFEEIYGGRRLQDVVDDMMHSISDDDDLDIDHEDDDHMENEDEELDDDEAPGHRIMGDSDASAPGLEHSSDDGEDDSDSGEDEDEDDDEDEDEDHDIDIEDEDDDEEDEADIVVDGEEEMAIVQEDGIIPHEEDDQDGTRSREIRYWPEEGDDEDSWAGDGDIMDEEQDEGWETADEEDMNASIAMPWAGGAPGRRHGWNDFLSQRPEAVDDIMDEIFAVQSRAGMEAIVRDGGHRRRYRLVGSSRLRSNGTSNMPVSASMFPQQHHLLQRPVSLAAQPGVSGQRNHYLGLPGLDNASEITLQNLFMDAMGMRRTNAQVLDPNASFFVFGGEDEMQNIMFSRGRRGNDGGHLSLSAIMRGGLGGAGDPRASHWGDGGQRGTPGNSQGLQISLESLMADLLSTNQQTPATNNVVPQHPSPEGQGREGLTTDLPAVIPGSASAILDRDIQAAQQQLSTQRLASDIGNQEGQLEGEDSEMQTDVHAQELTQPDQPAPEARLFEESGSAPVTMEPSGGSVQPGRALFQGEAVSSGSLAIQQEDMAEALRVAMAALDPQAPAFRQPSAPSMPDLAPLPCTAEAVPEAETNVQLTTDHGMDATKPEDEETNVARDVSPAQQQGGEAHGVSAGDAATLDDASRAAAEAAGVDIAFLEALPPELWSEVLSQYGVHMTRPTAYANPAHQAAGSADEADDNAVAVDPDFLAALPPEIQAEVLAEQEAERRRRQRQQQRIASEAAAAASSSDAPGQGGADSTPTNGDNESEMDMATILATFPPDLREEVLLTGDETLLASLPPALMAEAQTLRERALRGYTGDGLMQMLGRFGRNQRLGGSGLTATARGPSGAPGAGPSASSVTRRSGSSSLGTENEPDLHMDEEAIAVLVQLMRLSQPLGKSHVQKLFNNICMHSLSRANALRMLMSLLRAAPSQDEVSSASSAALHPAGAAQVLAPMSSLTDVIASQQAQTAPSLPASIHVTPLVARRVLDLVTWLARCQPAKVAQMLLSLGVPLPAATALARTALGGGSLGTIGSPSGSLPDRKGKRKIEETDAEPRGGLLLRASQSEASVVNLANEQGALEVLLEFLNRPLCQRSTANLEQALHLLEVILGAGKTMLLEVAAQAGVSQAGDEAQGNVSGVVQAGVDGPTPGQGIPASGSVRPQAVGPGSGCLVPLRQEVSKVLAEIPQPLIRQLPQLLGRAGLSLVAYNRLANVTGLLVQVWPGHQQMVLSELSSQVERCTPRASQELESLEIPLQTAHHSGVAQLPSGPLVLRLLQAVSAMCCIATKRAGTSKPRQQQGRSTSSLSELLPGPVDPEQLAATRVVVDKLSEKLQPLWTSLSRSIASIEAKLPDRSHLPIFGNTASGILPPAASQILPIIEAFFVLCSARSSLEDRGDSKSKDDLGLPFLRFAEQHRRLLNTLVRQNPSLLEGSLAPLLRLPRLVEFENKRAYFQSRMRSSREDRHYGGTLRICVRRDHVFEDSFHQLRMRTPDEMRCKLSVQFHGEEGIDAGGVSREWYQVMAREIFNPALALFVNVPEGGTTFQPNPNSMVQNDEARGTNHLDFFRFVGRVVGKALHDGQLIDAYFTRSFYKHMLGMDITYEDIEAVDPEYYRTLKWMLENQIKDVLDMNFTAELDYFGKKQVVELREGGAAQKVTDSNKSEYVSLVARYVMTNAIHDQLHAFLEGFWDLAPQDLVQIFNDHELELLISGLPEIDIDDLRANTEYTGYTAASQVVQWFWEIVREMDKQSLALLLQFITGTSKVPLEGFKALQGISGPQRFQIHKAYGAVTRLPSAHTCFNQLDLIEYETKEQLLDRLMVAIHEGSEGFGFG